MKLQEEQDLARLDAIINQTGKAMNEINKLRNLIGNGFVEIEECSDFLYYHHTLLVNYKTSI